MPVYTGDRQVSASRPNRQDHQVPSSLEGVVEMKGSVVLRHLTRRHSGRPSDLMTSVKEKVAHQNQFRYWTSKRELMFPTILPSRMK